MNAVDGSEHYERTSDEPPPSLLTIILDTNPHAWALLSDTLPLSKAVANLLVFINAHLAFNYANKVAIIASHTQRAEILYPSSSSTPSATEEGTLPQHNAANQSSDIDMGDSTPPFSINSPTTKPKLTLNGPKPVPNGTPSLTRSETAPLQISDANKYRPFRLVEETLHTALQHLLTTTTADSLSTTPTTSIAGALTLALTYTHKQTLLASSTSATGPSSSSVNPINPGGNDGLDPIRRPMLQSRILILSVSGDLAHQYIPLMNCIFACQRLQIPIDICKIAGDTVFLQQASDATRGTYIKLEHPRGLLQYLMMGFLPDQTSRGSLVAPTQVGVDFRAACFCHRRVVNTGFVCSICLSIFCSPPEGAICLTCGTHLRLGDYGGKPAVVQKRKKKRKDRVNGGAGTPASGETPGPA
ncbi:RNA polymerase II transcription factor B subunit 4 [Hypocenomyce scalaris]|nr:RNA polymerase II transcription factor B subunit 4 [Hypocenomyce scalaris]